MKTITAVITFFIIFQSFLHTNKADIIPVDFFTLVQNENFELENWRVYQREEIGMVKDFDELQRVAREIGGKVKVTDWKFERMEKHHYKGTGISKSNNKEGLSTRYILIGLYEKGHFNVTVSQIVTGKDQDSYNQLHLQRFNKREKPSIFYTLTATNNKGFHSSEMRNTVSTVLKSLSAKKTEELEEENFLSISSYSPMIKNNLPLEDSKKMNLQVAIRVLENKTTLTIGSPIIITEY